MDPVVGICARSTPPPPPFAQDGPVAVSKPRLVFLYGPPAVGKLSVAKAIAERADFRVLHNHVTLDAVGQVLPFGTPAFFDVVDRMRVELLESAAREGVDVVYTFVFAPGDESHVDRAVAAYERFGGSVTLVQLVASPDELRRRVTEPGRKAHGKISDVETLAKVLSEHDVFAAIPARASLRIDLGASTVDEAAEEILKALEREAGEVAD